jgi:hypothetical protein
MYLKAISTAFSALSALASVGRALGASATSASESASSAPAEAPIAVAQAGRLNPSSLQFTRESLTRETANFADTLRQKLAARGVDLSVAPVVTSDFEGKLRVGNAHRDKDKIEAALAEDPALQQQFAALSAQYSLQRAADSQSVFAADYARAGNDAAAYAAVVERQIAYNQANFSLSVGAAGQTPVFGVTLRA